MNDKLLFKNKSTYLKLIIFTGLTGGYNFYLDKNKNALKMMAIFIVSLLLTPIYCIGLIGITLNIFLWLMDLIRFKKDVNKYNEHIEQILLSNNACDKVLELKKKNIKEYKLSILMFGLLGLEDLYIENYSLKSLRFIINGIYLLFFSMIIIGVSIGGLYVVINYPESARQGAMWMVIFFMWALMFPFLPLIMVGSILFPILAPIMVVITLYKIISKISNAEYLLLEFNNSLKKSISNPKLESDS